MPSDVAGVRVVGMSVEIGVEDSVIVELSGVVSLDDVTASVVTDSVVTTVVLPVDSVTVDPTDVEPVIVEPVTVGSVVELPVEIGEDS